MAIINPYSGLQNLGALWLEGLKARWAREAAFEKLQEERAKRKAEEDAAKKEAQLAQDDLTLREQEMAQEQSNKRVDYALDIREQALDGIKNAHEYSNPNTRRTEIERFKRMAQTANNILNEELGINIEDGVVEKYEKLTPSQAYMMNPEFEDAVKKRMLTKIKMTTPEAAVMASVLEQLNQAGKLEPAMNDASNLSAKAAEWNKKKIEEQAKIEQAKIEQAKIEPSLTPKEPVVKLGEAPSMAIISRDTIAQQVTSPIVKEMSPNAKLRISSTTRGAEVVTQSPAEPMKSTVEGNVVKAGFNDKIGNFVSIKTPEGKTITYSNVGKVYVKEGDVVSKGQPIASSKDYTANITVRNPDGTVGGPEQLSMEFKELPNAARIALMSSGVGVYEGLNSNYKSQMEAFDNNLKSNVVDLAQQLQDPWITFDQEKDIRNQINDLMEKRIDMYTDFIELQQEQERIGISKEEQQARIKKADRTAGLALKTAYDMLNSYVKQRVLTPTEWERQSTGQYNTYGEYVSAKTAELKPEFLSQYGDAISYKDEEGNIVTVREALSRTSTAPKRSGYWDSGKSASDILDQFVVE